MVWYCFICQKIHKIDNESETERKLFPRYIDFIMSTLSGEPDGLIKIVNNRDKNGNLAFLDININVNSSKQLQKSNDFKHCYPDNPVRYHFAEASISQFFTISSAFRDCAD